MFGTGFRPSAARWPWLIALLGLLHGFGFAGALAESGFAIIMRYQWLSLFFNLGVEIGQLGLRGRDFGDGKLWRRAMLLRFESAPDSASGQPP